MPALVRVRGALALLLASLLLLGGTPTAFADTDLAPGAAAAIAYTNGDVILLRSDAGYQFTVLAHLAEGARVTVLNGPVEGDDGNLWYKVDANGTAGYLFAAFLVRADRAPTPPTTGKANVRETTDAKAVVGTGGDGLRLRDGADLGAAVLAVLPEGATVSLTGAPRLNGGQAWYPVAYAGLEGWAVGDYLGAASSATSAPATNRQALALTIGEHVAVSNTGGWPLRLRAASNLDAATLAAAPEDAVLRVLDGPLSDAAGNAWYAVGYDGVTGYASAAYLSRTDAALSVREQPVAAAGVGATAGDRVAVSNTGGWPLRIRVANGADAATLAAAPEGAVLQVLDGPIVDKTGSSWYAVSYDGLQGYAGASYLSATDRPLSARSPTASVEAVGAAVLADGAHVAVDNTGGWDLRIRESAGLAGGVLAAAREGTVLRVLDAPIADGEGNAWYRVDYDGIVGYARASYLQATDRAPSARLSAPMPQTVVAAVASAVSEPAAAPPAVAAAPSIAPAPAPAAQPQRTSVTAPQAPVAEPVRATGSFIWPAQGSFTQGFGGNAAFYGPGGHNGVDVANGIGTPVVAADAGVVTYAGWKGGLGNAVVIDHGNGLVTEYGHGSALNVGVGQRVARGQRIMAMGSTGNSTGSHVHFSVIRNGVYVNPLGYLPAR